jgi:hypothetical protein
VIRAGNIKAEQAATPREHTEERLAGRRSEPKGLARAVFE